MGVLYFYLLNLFTLQEPQIQETPKISHKQLDLISKLATVDTVMTGHKFLCTFFFIINSAYLMSLFAHERFYLR